MKPPIITGKTTDGKPTVYGSLFMWKDQEGIPLEITANAIMNNGYAIDWLHEIEGALWQGFTEDQIKTDLKETFQFLYNPTEVFMIMGKVNFYFENREQPSDYVYKAMKLTKP